MPGEPAVSVLNINNSVVTVTDLGGIPSDLVIDRGAGAVFHMNIELGGTSRAAWVGETAKIKFFAEALGPNPNQQLGSEVLKLIPALPGNPTSVAVASLPISGASLPPDGLYRLTCVTSVPGGTAFSTGPIIEIVT